MAVPTFAELKVLIIDDSPIVIASLRSMLLKFYFVEPILCGAKPTSRGIHGRLAEI